MLRKVSTSKRGDRLSHFRLDVCTVCSIMFRSWRKQFNNRCLLFRCFVFFRRHSSASSLSPSEIPSLLVRIHTFPFKFQGWKVEKSELSLRFCEFTLTVPVLWGKSDENERNMTELVWFLWCLLYHKWLVFRRAEHCGVEQRPPQDKHARRTPGVRLFKLFIVILIYLFKY